MIFNKYILIIAFSVCFLQGQAQFYNGSSMSFGKNRVQNDDFLWTFYKFRNFNVYFYNGGQNTAIYTAKLAEKTIAELEKKFDYYLEEDERMSFIVYNKIEHFRQSNIGLDNSEDNNIGGVTRIAGTKMFVYFEGEHYKLEKQIKTGIAEIIINQMMFGDNWRDVVKNSTLLTIPDWYKNGLISYAAEPWSVETENIIKDGILSGRYKRFNRLSGKEATYSGHAIWNYIAETYGANVIPNVLYMSRISRNIESGFLFVLGSSLKTLNYETIEYYKRRFSADEETRTDSKSASVIHKSKKNRIYTQLKLSPDGKHAAFSTNQMGKTKVFVYDIEKNKIKKIYRQGHKLERINDTGYPLIQWHPTGKILSFITEKNGEIRLNMYTPETSKTEYKPIFKVEKILDFSYSDDGKKIVFSAISNGQSDVFIYKIAPNIQEQITNDIFDDLFPRFINNSTEIIFSSNRIYDTLKTDYSDNISNYSLDLFVYNYNTGNKVLRRVTDTKNSDEFQGMNYDKSGKITYLSNQNGIVNRYHAVLDSVISYVDTAFHYRYVTKSFPITNYSRNIIQHDFNLSAGKYTELLRKDGKYKLLYSDISTSPADYSMDIINTNYKENQLSKEERMKIKPEIIKPAAIVEQEIIEPTDTIIPTQTDSVIFPQNSNADQLIDIYNYRFDIEAKQKNTIKEQQVKPENKTTTKSDLKTDKVIPVIVKDTIKEKPTPFILPNERNYYLAFSASEITSQFDFDFANQLYQRYNGGPYMMPGMGTVVKITMKDLFEDHVIDGGLRFSYSNNNIEYFLSYENRQKRLDKKYSFQRQTMSTVNDFSIRKFYINQFRYGLSWPFNEVSSVRSTFNLRTDKTVYLSTDLPNLILPDERINWGGIKVEYIFDNTIKKGLNLYNGTRLKFFAEHYRQVSDSNTDITILGTDIRYYQKIHRDLIWANRFAASTSLGSRKLVYYLGSVDNWVVLTDRPRFDYATNIATDQNYYWQTIATPVRGFIQNSRNGNSFAVINSEIRWPIFKYFSPKPIKSDFWANFQTIFFGDMGTAWTGKNPYADDNAFNIKTVVSGPLKITIKNQKDPLIGGFGYGFRTRMWGYFIRFDHAWGVEDGEILTPINYLSLGLDF